MSPGLVVSMKGTPVLLASVWYYESAWGTL